MLRTLVFHAATVMGAFLLFLVQPLMAKQVLPWFGGAPAVWSACLVFFQVALIAGYLYAHVTRRLSVYWQAGLHVSLLLAALFTLPILVSPEWKPVDSASPSWRVVMLLAATIGIPYMLLGATAPLLQDWWRVTSGREPYRLYALSNLGSLAALGLYPTAVERFLSVPDQAYWWSAAYGVFVVTCAGAAWAVTRSPRRMDIASPITGDAGLPVTTADVVLWMALAACGSGLLLAVTNQLCQDVAVVPLLWVIPLAIYLLTFVMTFASVYPRRLSRILFLTGVVSALLVTVRAASVPLPLQAIAFLSLLAGACMVCHGELVAARPAPRYLTGFYLAIAVGGALGGLFVAFAAPALFTSYLELPTLTLLVVMLVALPASGFGNRRSRDKAGLMLVWAAPAIVFAVVVGWAEATGAWGSPYATAVRDFYGILRVADHGLGTDAPWRGLSHGRVTHGIQWLAEDRSQQPTSYYAEGSGVAVAFEQHPRRRERRDLRAGIVGLGAGTIAAWGRAGDRFRFFELNPNVVDLAHRDFTFLRDSPAAISVVTADARLALEREMADPANHGTYDVLVIDAFSGDSIPAHLLTRECFALYVRALAPSGVIAFHISNLFLDLRPLVHGLAEDAGWGTVEVRNGVLTGEADRQSDWVLASSDREFLAQSLAAGAIPPVVGRRQIWTDSHSSIFSVLR